MPRLATGYSLSEYLKYPARRIPFGLVVDRFHLGPIAGRKITVLRSIILDNQQQRRLI